MSNSTIPPLRNSRTLAPTPTPSPGPARPGGKGNEREGKEGDFGGGGTRSFRQGWRLEQARGERDARFAVVLLLLIREGRLCSLSIS